MMSHKNRIRRQFRLEALEGRVALSGMGGGGLDDAIHGHRHRGGHAAEVRGHNDPANHDANDNRGGVRGPRADDPANHDANDNRGGVRGPRADDPANHDANDHRRGRG